VLDSDVLFHFRLRLFDHAREVGVSEACRTFGIHRSTYYRWKAMVEASGLEMLRPRERRAPRMPNQTNPVVEERVLAFAIAHPGLGPRRISATLAQARWGGIGISHTGVWRILRRHGLSRRVSRLSLVAGYAAPPDPGHLPEPERHLEVDHPGELVGFDCFHVGRLSGTRGRVWQYTAIDLATSYTWAELHTTPLNPSARNTSALARRVAADLAARDIEHIETWLPGGHFLTTGLLDAGWTREPEPLGIVPTARSFDPELTIPWVSENFFYTMADSDLQ